MPIDRFGPEHKDTVLTWLTTERRLARAVLKAAAEDKGRPGYPGFIDDVTALLWWLRDGKVTAPRGSLSSLIRAAKAWEEDQLAIARSGSRRWWTPRTLACADGVHEAVLLDGPAAVLEEARAMRNCLRARLTTLSTLGVRLWSVRHKATSRRLAVIEMKREDRRWTVGEIAGRFNRPAPTWIRTFAETLAVCESLKVSSKGGRR